MNRPSVGDSVVEESLGGDYDEARLYLWGRGSSVVLGAFVTQRTVEVTLYLRNPHPWSRSKGHERGDRVWTGDRVQVTSP